MPVKARNRPLAPNRAAESILDFDAQMDSRDARENHRREQAHEHMTNFPESERAAAFVAEDKMVAAFNMDKTRLLRALSLAEG
jgi:hypothetical protein